MEYRVLILGSGGREYAIGLHLLKDSRIKTLFFAPGNGATQRLGQNMDFKNSDELIKKIQEKDINFVIVGAENFIADGISDDLRLAGIKVFAPSKEAGRLESSKAFMKDFVTRYNIPTARYIQTDELDSAKAFLQTLKPPYVIKADGLCAGKGVVITEEIAEAFKTVESFLSGEAFGQSGKRVVIEEFMDGFELSVFAICDGEDFVILPACQDHKRLLDGDMGPNTGGMGAYAPSPLCDEKLIEKIKTRLIAPTLAGMKKEDNAFCGVLFAGVMVRELDNELEPYLLEYNVRFGDPECEVLMPLLKTPLIDICEAVLNNELSKLKVEFYDKSAMAVVAATKEYPYTKPVAQKITFKDYDGSLGHFVFAGVENKEGVLFAGGGRVLLSVGVAKDLKTAHDNAYKLLESAEFEGMHYRNDIGYRALK